MTVPSDVANAVIGAQKSVVGIGSLPQWLTLVAVIASIVTIFIKTRPGVIKATSDADTSLRDAEAALRTGLITRIENLEYKVDENEAECAKRIDAAIKANDDRWELRIERIMSEHRMEVEGFMRQIASLQVDSGKVLRLAGGSSEPSTSMERVVSRAISEITDKLDPPT